MKIGVVGGTGNISTSVVRLLLDQGHDVTCITRGDTAVVPEGARHLRGDRNDTEWFIDAVRREEFDAGMDFIAYVPAQAAATREAFRGVGHLIHTSTVTTIGSRADWLPITEDHPARPETVYGQNKSIIDRSYQAAHYDDDLPVTIVTPSTTYGRQRVVRQLGVDTRWIRRIREGRPLVNVDGGAALHQLLHVDDAALAYAAMVGRERCIGQTYFLVHPDPIRWYDVHRAAMDVLGREVEQVGVSADLLADYDHDRFDMVRWIFALNVFYSVAKLQRDVPEFAPRISLREGLSDAFDYLESEGLIEEVPVGDWEDTIIGEQMKARSRLLQSRDGSSH